MLGEGGALLEAEGHHVLAPDLPGMGADKTPLANISLTLWGDFVAHLTRAQSEHPILVGHSRGGTLTTEAAERAPEAIAGLVYLAAMLLPNGESQKDIAERSLSHLLASTGLQEDGISSTFDPSAV